MSKKKNGKSFGKKNQGAVQNGIFIYEGSLTLDQLCKKAGISAMETIKTFLLQGKMVSLNTILTDEQIQEICLNNDLDVKKESASAMEDFTQAQIYDKDLDTVERSPVVTIMGHVDHGKTTLIDAIRHSTITAGEHGGITQEIGSYQKSIGGKKITFIDTPGHEAFTAMRARGASMTDIVILVVAADDGVKPQTIEAIDHAKAADVPIIVAINKMDKPSANPERVKTQLSAHDVLCEEWGGDCMVFEISAKKNQGIEKLLEGVLTLAEILELRCNPPRKAIGSVIEAELDKKEGPKATLLVQNGTLHIGDFLAIGQFYCKVRRMTNEFNQTLKEAGPSTPVSVTGISGVPVAGDRFMAFEDEKEARNAADKRATAMIGQNNQGTSLADLSNQAKEGGEIPSIRLIVKTDTEGSAEAVKASLLKIDVPGTQIQIMRSTSGDISQGDLVLAQASKAVIIAFASKVSAVMKNAAKELGIEIREYNIIYKLLEDIENALRGQLGPVYEEVVYGHGEVRSLFKASKVGQIAGLMVTDGSIKSNCKIRVYRNNELMIDTRLTSLKRFKDDAKEVLTGFECGATIADNFNLEMGDILEAYGMEEKKNG